MQCFSEVFGYYMKSSLYAVVGGVNENICKRSNCITYFCYVVYIHEGNNMVLYKSLFNMNYNIQNTYIIIENRQWSLITLFDMDCMFKLTKKLTWTFFTEYCLPPRNFNKTFWKWMGNFINIFYIIGRLVVNL